MTSRYEDAPVPASTGPGLSGEWPEARGFRRLYSGNPEYQARFVMALFGFRSELLQGPQDFRRLYSGNPEYQARLVMVLFGFKHDLQQWAHDEESAGLVDGTILAFHGRYPEFMQDGYEPDTELGMGKYRLDPRLEHYMNELTEKSGQPATDEESVRFVDGTVLAFHGRHPEFMQNGYQPDSDFGTGPYQLEPRLVHFMGELIKKTSESAAEG